MQIKGSTNKEDRNCEAETWLWYKFQERGTEVLRISCNIFDEILRGSELGKHKS